MGIAAGALTLLLLALPAAVPAAPGDSDSTFGTAGKVFVPVGSFNAQATAAVVQSDGKLVLAGFAFQDGPTTDADFVLIRLNQNGSLDTTFGGGGIVTTPVNLVANGDDFARGVALGPSGTIVVGGWASTSAINSDFAVARYTSTGALDSSFSGDGIQTVNVGSFDRAFAVKVQQGDGKIVLGGQGGSGFTLVRLLASGQLDTTFGAAGKVDTAMGGGPSDKVAALSLGSDGSVLAAGTADFSTGAPSDFALARYTANGQLDPGFGTAGRVITAGAGQEEATSLANAGDGRIVVSGVVNDLAGKLHFRLARYLPAGALDGSFGPGGVVTTTFPPVEFAAATGVVIQSDGKVLAGGAAFTSPGAGGADFAVARYNDDGSLDSTFGDGGKRTYGVGSFNDFANALVLQPIPSLLAPVQGASYTSGRTVLTGTSYDGVREQISALALKLIDEALQPPPPPPVTPPASPPVTPPAAPPATPPAAPPATPTTPPPPPAPAPRRNECECKNIKTRTSGFADFTASDADRTAFSFRVQWTMNCAGRQGGCKGEIDVDPPGDLKLKAPKKASVDCNGKCRAGEAITQTKGTFRVAGTSLNTLDTDRRAGREFTFRFKKFCIRDGKRVAAGRGFMTVAYGPTGQINRKASDLNGDLKPDGGKGRR